jgi:hypothetical protein
MESFYLSVKNFVVMVVNTFLIDFSQIFNILSDIKVKSSITLYIILWGADEFDMKEHFPRYSLDTVITEGNTRYFVHTGRILIWQFLCLLLLW